jgi:TatD DNase family protein
MTRSLDEAEDVAARQDRGLTWGLGVHPGVASARASFDPDRLRALLPHFAIVGEVGLDRRAVRQDGLRVFTDVLQACIDQPVLISVHSAGRTADVVDMIERHQHPGLILHWFLGNSEQLARALSVGAYFSVNTAMSVETLSAIPRDRILPETDFPARRIRARLPGAIEPLEGKLSALWGDALVDVRSQLWHNLKTVAVDPAMAGGSAAFRVVNVRRGRAAERDPSAAAPRSAPAWRIFRRRAGVRVRGCGSRVGGAGPRWIGFCALASRAVRGGRAESRGGPSSAR